ncbi:hypothetical protein POM88_030737 [Heracleum sosnowskyi]|uniref:Pentatricopeptide repeat-containing protein n=1 Tax=Heracleum sosnowskyi TaxID=360622 RepID=A0AAD8HW30_9APIA|nr:hypothetical protein POM88_030737 [Heracleum sosnowskyi]
MKETGLIPNAVSMLHGLCQDGLVQEAMKLFSLMHETGTIPEVIIYTDVIEGFCKAHKLDDAKRIFRKMQGNGISPNAITYGVLIQGLVHKKSLDDALVFSVEMFEAGHSPNLATFTGLVDCFFNWFFFAINMGALLGITVMVYIQQEKGFGWGFAVPTVEFRSAMVPSTVLQFQVESFHVAVVALQMGAIFLWVYVYNIVRISIEASSIDVNDSSDNEYTSETTAVKPDSITEPLLSPEKYNTSEDSEDSLPCTRFDETKQLGFTDKVKQNIVEISRKLNVKRLFAPSTNGAEGFAFAHCTTCKSPYRLRLNIPAGRKWRTLKFRFTLQSQAF